MLGLSSLPLLLLINSTKEHVFHPNHVFLGLTAMHRLHGNKHNVKRRYAYYRMLGRSQINCQGKRTRPCAKNKLQY
jgi:hypothetical protein